MILAVSERSSQASNVLTLMRGFLCARFAGSLVAVDRVRWPTSPLQRHASTQLLFAAQKPS